MLNAVCCLTAACTCTTSLYAVLLLLGNIRSAGMHMPGCASLSITSAEKTI